MFLEENPIFEESIGSNNPNNRAIIIEENSVRGGEENQEEALMDEILRDFQ